MKNVLLAVGALLSLGLGIGATVLLMPYLSPETVAEHERQDSLAASMSVEADSLLALQDTSATVLVDTFLTSARRMPVQDTLIRVLQDSIGVLTERLEERDGALAALRKQMRDTEAQVATLEGRTEQAAELTKTLSRMEIDELTPILSRISMATLKQLYSTATGRNKTKLLQAMPSERAARFVNQVLAGEVPSDVPADTSQTPSS